MVQDMQVSLEDASGAGILFAGLALMWGLFVTIFWMVVGWRAMRAHERIADSSARLAEVRSTAAEPPQAGR